MHQTHPLNAYVSVTVIEKKIKERKKVRQKGKGKLVCVRFTEDDRRFSSDIPKPVLPPGLISLKLERSVLIPLCL